jgi:5-formyltetrahydrofolate cyclo-ligase
VSKIELRKHYRDLRSHVAPMARHAAALAAADLLVHLPLFKASRHIACYLSLKNEFDTMPLIEAIWKAKKHCYLPVLTQHKDDQGKEQNLLKFIRYEYGDPLHMNRYSILEPSPLKKEIALELIDVVIMPLVAFDSQGHRLGTGGGYYDRTFASRHSVLQDDPNKKPKMIGLGYTIQQAESLPEDPWDLLLDNVLTEKSFIHCGK